MNAAELFVKCLENEGVEYIFGIPGEENLAVMDALLESNIQFITCRHEQGAAFMADVYGRLTGKTGVCMATLGPGATNLITGVADANMDYAPLVAIAGQASTERLHKESHQVLDLDTLFQPITKFSTTILSPHTIPEVVRKAFKVTQNRKPGACFIEFPENIADMDVDEIDQPLFVKNAKPGEPAYDRIKHAIEVISEAKNPIIMVGNGVIRENCAQDLVEFAERLNIPVANTFMAKGVISFHHALALGTVGLQAHDFISCGFDTADVIICVGYDIVEYHPYLWNPKRDKRIVHIDTSPTEVDAHYTIEVGAIGNIKHSLQRIGGAAKPLQTKPLRLLRKAIKSEMEKLKDDTEFPVKPQKLIWDLRKALNDDDIVICDVGAHKMWVARMYRCETPNGCIISNGFASMGIAVPGAIAAKLAYPDKKVVAATGDAGFLMNSQEIETAVRYKIPIVILVWNDSGYGLIEWKQINQFGRPSNIDFNNPDFVKYAESFGAKGYRVESTEDLLPTLKKALADDQVVIIDCPVDYRENLKLTKELGESVCPV